MPDTKLTNLTADTARALTDLIYMVTDPSGTPASRKMTVLNFLREDATELTISSGAVTFTQLNHKLQPQSGTADDLDTINGTTAGQSGTIYVSDFGTDTITIKHNTGNILCVGDADIALSNGCVFWYSNGTKVFISGGGGGGGDGGLTNTNISPTTSNYSAVAGNRYFADISGLTANRNFVLPTPAVGDEIELSIVTGDDTYALIVIGDTGITINGGSAATEWSRLFIKGETIRLVANSVTNWQIVTDGRIPSECRIKNTGAQTVNTGTFTDIVLDEADYDNASLGNTGTYVITARRANKYIATGQVRMNALGTNRFVLYFKVDGGSVFAVEQTTGGGSYPSAPMASILNLAAGNYVSMTVYHEAGVSKDTYVAESNTALAMVEVLA